MAQKYSTGLRSPALTTTRSIPMEDRLLGVRILRRHTRASPDNRSHRVPALVYCLRDPKDWLGRTLHQFITREESEECSSPKHRYVWWWVPTSGCMTSWRQTMTLIIVFLIWMTSHWRPSILIPFSLSNAISEKQWTTQPILDINSGCKAIHM